MQALKCTKGRFLHDDENMHALPDQLEYHVVKDRNSGVMNTFGCVEWDHAG